MSPIRSGLSVLLALIFIGLLLPGCGEGKPAKTSVAPVGSRKVIAPDRIYFKNIRSVRYAATDDHQEHRTTYLHRKLADGPVGWQIQLTDDWLNDRAWLAFLAKEPALFYRVGAEQEEIVLLKTSQLGELEALSTFANRLAAPYEICYRTTSTTSADCLGAQSTQRLAFRETITDFLRLTAAD